MDLPRLHQQALDHTGVLVRGIGADQWSATTPCEGWDVRTLVNHVVGGNLWVVPLVEGKTIAEVGEALDGDVVGDNPAAAYDASAGPAGQAFAAPGALEAMVAVSYGPVPGQVYCGHRFVDVLIHGWDVAVATGQSTVIDPELVEACWQIAEPQAHLFRGAGAFGPAAEVPADADRQTQLLALTGRAASGPA